MSSSNNYFGIKFLRKSVYFFAAGMIYFSSFNAGCSCDKKLEETIQEPIKKEVVQKKRNHKPIRAAKFSDLENDVKMETNVSSELVSQILDESGSKVSRAYVDKVVSYIDSNGSPKRASEEFVQIAETYQAIRSR